MKRQRFSVLVWNWQPPLCLSLNFLRSAMPHSASRRLRRSRLLWFIAPLTFSNHFSNCPICRALCKPAAVNEESSNWQTLVQFALLPQNKCVPCELADLTHDFSRPNFPACERMPAEPVEAKPSVKNIVTTHPQAAVRLCLHSFIPKGCRPVTPKTPQAQMNNTCKQTLLMRLTSNRAVWQN